MQSQAQAQVRIDLPIQCSSASRRRANNLLAKRGIDIVLSLFLVIVLTPVLILIFVCLKMNGGHAIFRHPRLGRQGSMFNCLKFRTMVPNAENLLQKVLDERPELRQEWQSSRKIRHDPRVTRIGDFLRRTSLDELPQIFNVLRGDMSLVGPRPVMVDELHQHYLGLAADAYLSVRPGITGLWQVSGRSNVDYVQRVQLDCHYVNHISILGDLRLLLLTVSVLLQRRGAF